MQAPRPTALGDGLQRPQLSYSLPAQLPDPDQHMREVYMAAQAAAAEHSTKPNQVSMLHIVISAFVYNFDETVPFARLAYASAHYIKP